MTKPRWARVVRWGVVLSLVVLPSCKKGAEPLLSRNQTLAELRVVKRGVTVAPPGEAGRVPYARERLFDGETVNLEAGGLAWLRRDGGATLLVAGPATIVVRKDALELDHGKVFADTQGSDSAELRTRAGALHLASVRASVDADDKGGVEAYVLAGGVQTDAGASAGPGELLTLADGKATKTPRTIWDDWTGGLATADPAALPAPFGVGTVGARPPGSVGEARTPLAIQRLDVRVTVDGDFATTEVDEVFFNPTSETVEGIYRFRSPNGAVLQRFGVDRDGELVWGRLKEKQAAAAQYQSHVYQGSTEDPALLEWDAPGVYQARLYPIPAGATRRVVTRYSEWLSRQGQHGERRLYVYPMAAEGAESTLPRIEELTVDVDLTRARTNEVRVGMLGKQEGNRVRVKRFDFVPRADLSLELFDGGTADVVAYRTRHKVDAEITAEDQLERARKDALGEADYVLLPVRPPAVNEPKGGLDLAIVVDSSAAIDPGSLAISRALTGALLAHLGPADRAAVWAGDATLRAVADGSDALATVDGKRREAIATGLARIERGGATDLGAILAEAATKLEDGHRGVVVYLGDGRPTVGELAVKELRARLERLPRPTRLFAIGVGDDADMGVLSGLARGAFAERVTDGFGAAQAALRVLENAEEPVWLGASVDFGPGVDRIYPREVSAMAADQTVLFMGRVTGVLPTEVKLKGASGEAKIPLKLSAVADGGDLQRRWAEGRLDQLLEEGAGRAALVEVGVRFGVVTPVTSFYVPTAEERRAEKAKVAYADYEPAQDDKPWYRWPWFKGGGLLKSSEPVQVSASARAMPMEDSEAKEGGTGTRAKGEEGSMGNPAAPGARDQRFAVQGPREDEKRAEPMMDAPVVAAPESPAPAKQAAAALNKEKDVGYDGAKGGEPMPLEEAMREAAIGTAHARRPSAVSAQAQPAASATSATNEAAEFGMIGLLGSGTSGSGVGLSLGAGGGGKSEDTKDPIAQKPSASVADRLARSATLDDIDVRVRRTVITGSLGAIGHAPSPCPASAALPFDDRRQLWRERLPRPANGPALEVLYRTVLGRCEAPTWRERTALLVMLVEHLPKIYDRVQLWKLLALRSPQAADVVYRAILTRVDTAEEIRELHDALGIKNIDPDFLETALRAKKTPEERLVLLQELFLKWPDDLELGLRLLDGLEDLGKDSEARALARALRLRSDATTRVRTAIGELYLRLAKKETGAPKDRDTTEARRTFGEIVEFAPEDPGARRRLGDLLRTHQWYEEALRQYETLARLTPDDTSVQLLLASAANGMGRVEEAVRWAEQAGGASDDANPLGKPARALASAFLAWARADATKGDRKDEAARLRERAKRLGGTSAPTAGNVRVIATWTHPEFHPDLWANPLGTSMPAPDGNPLLGVAETVLPAGHDGTFVELRLAPADAERAARLGAEVTLTAITDEGADTERITRTTVTYAPSPDPKRLLVRRFDVASGSLTEESH